MKKHTHILFTINALMMSWGTRTATDNRPSDQVPTRSAILGMVSAALGIDRKDYNRLQQIQNGYLMACHMVKHGTKMEDYHTVQTAGYKLSADAPKIIRSRKQELEEFFSGTVETRREYIQDCIAIISLRPVNDQVPSCDELVEALNYPVFIPHFGRASCLPSLPLNPRVLSGATFKEVFDADAESERPWSKSEESKYQLFCWEGGKNEFDSQAEETLRNDRAKVKPYGISAGPYLYNKRKEYRVLRRVQ